MILLAAFGAWALAAAVSVLGARRSPFVEPAGWLLNAVGCVLAVVGAGLALAGRSVVVPIGALGDLDGGLDPAHLELDRLGGLFAVITYGVAVPACLAALRRPAGASRTARLPAAVAGCLAAVLIVLAADHVYALLFGWEALTLSFYLLTGFERRPAGGAAAVLTAVFGKASGAALLVGGVVGGVVGAVSGGGLGYAALARADGPARGAALALLVLGFAIKVGTVPVQIWLPPAYAAAPGPARPIMAGAAVNVGFYGMWRALELLGPAPAWLAIVMLLVAGVTAVLGIAHAAVHADLRGLVAWSSVENAGVIGAGYGVALVGSHVGDARLMAAGLLAATAQVIAHALGKSLLFVTVTQVEESFGSTDLDRLRNVAASRPWTGAGLTVGAMTLAGLPLTAGFASEWLTLESLMQQFRIDSLGMQLASAVAAALVALSLGIAGVTFVRLIALTGFGGDGRRPAGGEPAPHRAAVVLLVVGCLGTALVAPWELDLISAGVRPLVGATVDGAHASPFVLQPVYPGFSSLSPTWLWLVIPAYAVLVAALVSWASAGRLWRVRRVPAWSSGSPGVERGVGYTSFGYANPMRRVLANLLLTRHQLAQVATSERAVAVSLTDTGGPGADERSRPAAGELTYRVDVVEVVERYLYRPAYALVRSVARLVTRVQSGRLDAYLAYLLLVLIGVIAVVAALA
jgi:formate hydrogenlyase subunit 3/multisubunit Na+/H+ antiporter MnhD subunit